ncbi:MAG TPA: hypothetical protein PLQ82_03405 [Desulfobacteraceae bacterium]|nr:hypothetical protein [Desulfobacteraceae bacterium]
MNYRQSLASSVCIHLTEEDDEPPPNFSRNSDTATTSPLTDDPFPEKNNTGCPYFRRAFILEAGSTKSPFTAAQAVKRFPFISKINYPAAEQRGILKSIERPKGRGIEPSSAFYQPWLAGGLKPQSLRAAGYYSISGCMNKSISIPGAGPKRLCLKSGLLEALS